MARLIPGRRQEAAERTAATPPAGTETPSGARPDLDADQVDRPGDLSKPSLVAVVKRAGREFKNDNLTTLAAALTYYAVLAVIPGLIVLLAILGLVGHHLTEKVVTEVQSVAPGSTAKFVRTLVVQAQANRSGAGIAAVAGVVVALWSASSYVGSFRTASNIIYGIGEGRPAWKTIPIRLGVTVVSVVLLVVAAVIVVASGSVANEIGNTLGAGRAAVLAWDVAKWPVLLVVVSVLLAVLYWASPNAKQGGIRWVSPGGIIATVVWVIVSVLFAVYVATFSSYNRTYGSLAGIVVFLVWLWLTNVALLLGAEINAELDHARAIGEGLPEEVRPFVEPRDTRKLSEADKEAVTRAQAARGS
ncbi:MAG TPA: YihY/virulence factor BrkB family protein [Acidimicrobiales bacterium]|jgi:membrane protein|nr:YihY/virulence factor BrkB family protein [Acidimicrobiales bacterium]